MWVKRACLLLVFVVGCSKKEAAPKEAPKAAAVDAGAKPSDAGVAKVPVDAAGNKDEAEARALLDAWLAAQNQGRFDAYEKLYDASFEGIRRTGDKTVTLDRAKWMKDRKRMFGKKLHVEATDLNGSQRESDERVAAERDPWEWAAEIAERFRSTR